MEGRAQLEALALAIGSASDVDAAWAGSGRAVDLRKTCGICGENQPVRVPFLRHVCRSCTAIWVPGICGDCAHTSVTFTLDGQLSRTALCGCRGQLRQVAYVPKPREYVTPEVAAAREVVVHRRKKRLTRTSRTLLVLTAIVSVVGCVQFVRSTNHTLPSTQATTAHRPVTDPASLTPAGRGRAAAARLVASGRSHDAFSCVAVMPALGAAPVGTTSPVGQAIPAPNPVPTASALDPNETAYLAACLHG